MRLYTVISKRIPVLWMRRSDAIRLTGRKWVSMRKMAEMQWHTTGVLERFGEYTYIACELETGRTHQIRVHMASIHHPLLGDCVYGPAKCPWTLQGQTLHAKILGIIHPRTGKYMEFDAPLPEYFENLLKKLRKMSWKSIHLLWIVI